MSNKNRYGSKITGAKNQAKTLHEIFFIAVSTRHNLIKCQFTIVTLNQHYQYSISTGESEKGLSVYK